MPSRRFSAPPWLTRAALPPLGLSLLLHALFAAALFIVPVGEAPETDFVPVEFADLPRTTDFSPPEAGIVQGGVPRTSTSPRPAAAPPAPGAARPKGDDAAPPRAGGEQGAEAAAREAAEAAREAKEREAEAKEREAAAREAREREAEARARETAAREAAARDAAAKAAEAAAREEAERRRRAAEAAARKRILPSLGSLVARGAPGGRGDRPSSGSAVGTDAKARERGEITEEGGGGFQLTTLNAPEVQYAGYFDSIRRKIELVWQYPYDAAVAGIGGELLLEFSVGRSGRLERLELLRSSGHKVLDDEALRAVRKAAPFNPIPADFAVPELLIRGRFIYSHGGVREIR